MALLLLRHAEAGDPGRWDRPDPIRPLSAWGRAQAQALVGLFRPYAVTRVLTSPYVRCVQSVEPLADRLGLPVEERSELAEGTGAAPTLALLDSLAGTSAVLCTHGDVMRDVLGVLAASGLDLPGELPAAKGATWVLEGDGTAFVSARYLPPPG